MSWLEDCLKSDTEPLQSMISISILLFLGTSAAQACATDAVDGTEVCLLQLHKADAGATELAQKDSLASQEESLLAKKHSPLDDIAAGIAGDHHRLRQCPGKPYVAPADLT